MSLNTLRGRINLCIWHSKSHHSQNARRVFSLSSRNASGKKHYKEYPQEKHNEDNPTPPEFLIRNIQADSRKGFYLSFVCIPKEKCIEVHFKPQKDAIFDSGPTSTSENFSMDVATNALIETCRNHEGEALFDSRYSVYKRLHMNTIGNILAVFEGRQLLHEYFATSGERRIGFRKTRIGAYKLYLCGKQFRLAGTPKIEATFTFTDCEAVQLRHFLERAVRACIR